MLDVFAPIKKILRRSLLHINIHITSGKVRVPLMGGDGLQLLYHTSYEPWMRAFFKQAFISCGLNSRIALIDVGANIGQTLVSAMSSIENLQYIGVEPNPRCLSYLLKLRDANKYNDCSFISAPCASGTELAALHFNPSHTSPGSSLVEDIRPDNTQSIYCMPVSVEQIIRQFNLSGVDLLILKIDAEGLEYEICTSIPISLLKSLNLVIVVEVLPHVLPNQRQKLAKWCHDNNLSIFKIDTDVQDRLKLSACNSFSQSAAYSESESNYILLSSNSSLPHHASSLFSFSHEPPIS